MNRKFFLLPVFVLLLLPLWAVFSQKAFAQSTLGAVPGAATVSPVGVPPTPVAPTLAVAKGALGAGGLRDSILVRSGLMMISATGVAIKSDSAFLYGSFEYNRTFNPRLDLRIGGRMASNAKIARTQLQETFVGARYYPMSLGTDFSGPVQSYSLKWSFGFKPYIEGQLATGHYIADVIGEPPVYDLASSFFGFGAGAGCKVNLIRGIALDVGVNYEKGMSNGAVILDPSILHAYVGIAAAI